jgi:SNF2 family DNA or RNA helicase
VRLTRVRHRIPSNHNPFNYFDRSIISIDTLKNNLEYRIYLENAWWDIIVIDECHNVAARAAAQGKSRRARLAEGLAGRSDTLILLSATPHDSSARSFASLMALLDPTAISDPDDYTPKDYRHKGLVIRRFKKDIGHQVTGDFKERRTIKLTPQASAAEEAAYQALLTIRFTQGGTHRGGKPQELQRVAMQKAIFSSPFARLLLCSDVASEGLNLHYFCHRLIHFDLPWSLMVFQQRNGRVDRYGQAQAPQILYLFTATQVKKIRGDLRILEILQQKDEQATLNLGDPAAFLNVYDPDKEVEKVSEFMASGMTSAQVSATLDAQQANAQANEGDWLLQLFGGGTAAASPENPSPPRPASPSKSG